MLRQLHNWTLVVAIVLSSAGLTWAAAPPALAQTTTWYVATSGSDLNDCAAPATPCATVQAAVNKSSAGNVIRIAAGAYFGLGSQVVLVGHALTLSGGWNSSFTQQVGTAVLSGQETRRVIRVDNNAALTLNRIVVQHGYAEANGAGIETAGSLTLENSAVISNTTASNGGGIAVNFGHVRLTNTTISGNITTNPYGGWAGGAGLYLFSAASLSINSSTIVNNNATGSAVSVAGILGGGAVFTVKNSIIARNVILGTGADAGCSSDFTSLGYNLFSDLSCLRSRAATDVVAVDPQLGPLVWDSSHPVLPPRPTSAAVNAAQPDGCTDDAGAPLPADQRGRPRVARCDIGAYETDIAGSPPPATWFVATTGNDQSSCASSQAPCRTITAALGKTRPGDIISVAAGAYGAAAGETFPILLPPGVRLVGAGRDQTLIAGQNDRAVVMIDASVADVLSNTVISDLTLHSGAMGLRLHATQLRIAEPRLSRLRIRDNEVGVYVDSGVVYEYGTRIAAVLSDVEVINNRQSGVYASAYGYFSPAQVALLIEHSRVTDNGGHGLEFIGMNGPSVATPRIVATVIRNNGGHGLRAESVNWGSVRPEIEASTLQDNGGYGLSWAEGINGGFLDGVITNTVVARNRQGGLRVGGSYYQDRPPGSLRVVNSNIVNNDGYGVYWERLLQPIRPVILNSIIWNPGADDLYVTTGAWSVDEVSFSDIGDGDLNGQGGNFSADPLLLDDYRLYACSPVFNRGAPAGAPAGDIEGHPRPQGAAVDVGAWEAETPCWLSLNKEVSKTEARIGAALHYTISVTNTLAAVPLTVLITDAVPSNLSLAPGTLWATQGAAAVNGGSVTWSGTVSSGGVVQLGFEAAVRQARTTLQNYATAQAGSSGPYRSAAVSTVIEAERIFLPNVTRSYCRDFFDDFSSAASGWFTIDSNLRRVEYLQGEYRSLSKESGYLFLYRAPACPSESYLVEADMRWAAATGSDMGLIFGDTGDFNRFYFLDINTDYQAFALFRFEPEAVTAIAGPAQTGVIRSGTQTNHLAVRREGQTITVSVNGWTLGAWSDGAVTGLTYVGLAAGPYDSNPVSDARFDNFRITRLQDGGLSGPAQNPLPTAVLRPMPENVLWPAPQRVLGPAEPAR